MSSGRRPKPQRARSSRACIGRSREVEEDLTRWRRRTVPCIAGNALSRQAYRPRVEVGGRRRELVLDDADVRPGVDKEPATRRWWNRRAGGSNGVGVALS